MVILNTIIIKFVKTVHIRNKMNDKAVYYVTQVHTILKYTLYKSKPYIKILLCEKEMVFVFFKWCIMVKV